MDEKIGARDGSRPYRESLWELFGGKGKALCSNCGHVTGELATELDHNVPLDLGGYDVPSNVRPLCHACHAWKHYYERISVERIERIKEGQKKSVKVTGRPRNVPENYKDLLNDYVHCRIGKKELSNRWGVTVTSRKDPTKQVPVDMVHLVDKVWYRDYLKELGIAKVDNHVDYHISLRTPRTRINKGEYVGTITYVDGRTEELYR